MPRLSRLAAGAAALCALAIAAPAANADSIAYVKDGNVYLSTSDGARQFQVTSDGGYSDVSQADDGTMIALHGINLRKLDRQGNVLADFATPVSDARPAPAKTFYGPFDPAISPDGTKVAYSYYYMTQSQNPSCYPPTCYTTINEGGTGYSYSDRHDRLGRAGPPQALRLALPRVGRQQQAGARRTRRTCPTTTWSSTSLRAPASACSRAGSPTRCRTTPASAAAM